MPYELVISYVKLSSLLAAYQATGQTGQLAIQRKFISISMVIT